MPRPSTEDRPQARFRRRRWPWLVLSPVLGLILCEIVVRLLTVGPLPRVEVHPDFFSNLQPDANPELRVRPRPGAEKRVKIWPPGASKGEWIAERFNSQGFRGPELAVPKPSDVLRIACLGDSHTYGFGVEDQATWPAQMELALAQHFPEGAIEVFNAGVNAYDTAQEVQWLKHGVMAFEPDIVLLAYFANDASLPDDRLGDRLKGDRWLQLCHPLSDNWLSHLRRYSRAAEALAETVYRRRRFAHLGENLQARIAPESAGWIRSRRSLDTIREGLDQRDIPFGVVLFPMLIPAPQSEHGTLASSDPFRVVEAYLAETGVPHLDAEFALGGREPEDLRVSQGDLHAGAEAYHLVGVAVAEWLWSERAAFGL